MVAAVVCGAFLHLKLAPHTANGHAPQGVSGNSPQTPHVVWVAVWEPGGGEQAYWGKVGPSTQWSLCREMSGVCDEWCVMSGV